MGFFRLSIWIVVWVALGSCSGSREKGATAVIRIEDLAAQGDGFAVLVSVNSYADPAKTPTLSGPGNDMDRLADVLVARYGFAADRVLRLHDGRATREGIESALKALESRAEPGRQLVFAFAGHGSYVADLDPAEEVNGWDETICPSDRDLAGEGDLSDDVLYAYFSKILARGAYLTVIFDACYSGSAAKGGAITPRSAPPLEARAGAVASVALVQAHLSRFTVLAAADERQTAGEMYFEADILPAGNYGLFSHALNRALRRAPPDTTWSDLKVFLQEEIRRYDEQQRPVFRGDLQKRIFGTSLGRERHRFRISRVTSAGNVIHLEYGSMSGLGIGSLLAVYPSDTAVTSDRRRATARYRVTEVGSHHTVALLIPEKSTAAEKVVAGSAAVHILGGGVGDTRYVFLDETLPETFKVALLDAIADDPELAPLTAPADAAKTHKNFRITMVQGQGILIHGPTAPLSLTRNEPRVHSSAQEARDHMLRIVYWQKLRDIRNPSTENLPLPIHFQLESSRVWDSELGLFEPLEPLPLDLESGRARYREGDVLRLRYTNRSEDVLFVTVFYFTNNGQLIPWNQSQFDSPFLPNQEAEADGWIQVCPPLGARWLKLFVSRHKPLDPEPFLQGAKDPTQGVAEQIDGLEADWWTATLEFQTMAGDNPDHGPCEEDE